MLTLGKTICFEIYRKITMGKKRLFPLKIKNNENNLRSKCHAVNHTNDPF
jgi:hypothetical protein